MAQANSNHITSDAISTGLPAVGRRAAMMLCLSAISAAALPKHGEPLAIWHVHQRLLARLQAAHDDRAVKTANDDLWQFEDAVMRRPAASIEEVAIRGCMILLHWQACDWELITGLQDHLATLLSDLETLARLPADAAVAQALANAEVRA